jgi:hypothetical protein
MLAATPSSVPRAPRSPGRTHRRWLIGLTCVFAGRVVAQPLALVASSPYVPPFDAWHSGTLPYCALLASQAGILGWMTWSTLRVGTPAAAPRRATGRWLLAAGATYGLVMLARLALGATVLANRHWFASPLPTVFHLGLAAYLVTYGHFHLRHGA